MIMRFLIHIFFLLDSDLKRSEVTQRFESFWRTQIFIDFIYFFCFWLIPKKNCE